MDGFVDGLIRFLEANQDWAFWIALVFAFTENLAFLSIAIPSTAILVGVGALVATGAIPFTPIFFGAALGAWLGSTVSWWLGWRYGDWMLGVWPLKNYPDLVERGKASSERWGPFAIIIGHFFGPLRPVAFLLCGIGKMPFLYFQLFNVAGSVAWAYLVPKFGELGGDTIRWLLGGTGAA
jgi:membrane protein DedA with SNARE-associated domain